jgi:TonB-linked SusC/RagA family outer membrane protein
MRIAVILMIFGILLAHVNEAYSQKSRLSLNFSETKLVKVLDKIEEESDFFFLYNEKLLNTDRKVSIYAKDQLINEILDNLFTGTNVKYTIIDRKIILAPEYLTEASQSHQKKISGTVIGKDDMPIAGVNVVVKGTIIGVFTNINGVFSLSVPLHDTILVFSFIGYKIKEVRISDKTELDVTMDEDITQLDEVVVTALGIRREKKALSYSSQQISVDEISMGHDLNFVEGLNGKVAGIDIRQSVAGSGGSTKILLRGTKSFLSSSQPLFVIDGVPLANYQTSDPSGMWGGHDSGDGLSNLNPDDIESINILKGSNAAALYGSQGSNGVIIISTKKGAKGKTKIEISSSTAFRTPSILPKLQTSYGQTADGAIDSWGTKGSYSNPVKGFFRTGVDLLNSVSLSGGNENTSAYLSFANSNSQGIMPTNLFNKNNLTFSQKSEFFRNFVVSSNIMLTDQAIHNKMQNGYYWNPLTGLYLMPRGWDLNSYKDNYQVLDPNRNLMTQNWGIASSNITDTQQNPYWILNNDINTEKTKRIYAGLNLAYKMTEALSIQARGNYDYTDQIFEMDAKAGSSPSLIGGNSNGRWNYTNLTSTQQYADIILSYDKDFAGTFDINSVLGTSYQKRIIGNGIQIDSNTGGLLVPNEFYLNNVNTASFNGTLNSTVASRDIKESVFGNLSVGYKKMLYLDLSGRNEWTSTLALPGNNNVSYFYPSVGLSDILSQMLSLPRAINFAKLRASYSYVGKEIPSFMTTPENTVDPVNGIKLNTQVPYRALKPEMQKSFEFGAEMSFLNSRIGFEATYYNINNTNEFLPLTAPAGSGYTTYFVNAGEIKNKGAEVTLTIVPVKNNDLSWESNFNYSLNRNKIVKLDPTLKGQYSNGQGGEGYDMTIVEGGSIGDIYVTAFKRDANGNIILDAGNLPEKDQTARKIGSANPDFALGWNNTIKYKNFTLSFLIDGKFGGKFVDMTEAWYDGFGLSHRSADARDAGGVKVTGVTESGTPVSATVDAKSYYTRIGGRNSFVEPYVYDATNIRMRQVVLTYDLNLKPYHILFDNVNISLVGHNLFFFYLPAPFDPDNTISTGINSQSVENFCLPPTRSMGFNFKFNF